MKTFSPKALDQWREWLIEHHDSESEVWLIFHKRHTGGASIDYQDALDEALCFGWVDSLVKRLDDRRYARIYLASESGSGVMKAASPRGVKVKEVSARDVVRIR